MVRFPFLFLLITMAAILAWNARLDAQNKNYGIKGQEAPEWHIDYWIDEQGKTTNYQLSDFQDKVVILFCFQSWCPGCHKHGFPAMKKLVRQFRQDTSITFLAVQTVFEGFGTNTKRKIHSTQNKYDLQIPFGHDAGGGQRRDPSNIVSAYRTGGTPWFIVIDRNQEVVFNDYSFRQGRMERLLSQLKKQKP